MGSASKSNLEKDPRFKDLTYKTENNCLYVKIEDIMRILGITRQDILSHSDFFTNRKDIIRYMTHWGTFRRVPVAKAQERIHEIYYIPVTFAWSLVRYYDDIRGYVSPIAIEIQTPIHQDSLIKRLVDFIMWLLD